MSTEINADTVAALEKNIDAIGDKLAAKTAECNQLQAELAKVTDPNVLAAWARMTEKTAALAAS